MPNNERGLYEPPDDARVYDAVEDEEDTEGSRLPLLIVVALVAVAAFGAVVWLAYKQGVARGRDEPVVIAAAEGPAKVAPTEDQSGATPYQGLKIYEQPAPSDEDSEPAVAAAVVAPAPPPAVVPAMPTPPPPKPAPAVVSPAPAPQQAPMPPITARAQASPADSGAYMLQIGSFKSESDASAAWNDYQAKHEALLTGYDPDIQRVDLGEKGIWYRLRIGSFADKDVANALCDRLKANEGACILAAR